MAIFRNREREYCIVTNFKVMFTTLRHLPNMSRVTRDDLRAYTGRKYLIVRNPYHRIESFYRDKFQATPRDLINRGFVPRRQDWNWERCQYIFFDKFNVDTSSFEMASRALMATTFDDLIGYLPSKFMLDMHLTPQILAAYVGDGTRAGLWQVQFDEILQMEDEDHMAFLRRELGIDTSKRYNETASSQPAITWSAKAREIVNDLYKIDFEQLGYEFIDN